MHKTETFDYFDYTGAEISDLLLSMWIGKKVTDIMFQGDNMLIHFEPHELHVHPGDQVRLIQNKFSVVHNNDCG